jgi:Mrp family chromosome partitioning ATPase/capsular polysaccharide biosynthesis protein
MDAQGQEHSTLRDYLQVLRRRKWIVLTAVVVVPVAAYLFSAQQQSKYRATAEVLLSRQNLSQSLNGVQDPSLSIQPDRLAQTQADLAQVPPVIERTLRAAQATGITPAEFAADSSVSAKTDADLLTFNFTHHDPALAARLATEYARQYIAYRTQLDTQALSKARTQVQDRIAQLELGGDTKSALYASLVERDQQLQTMQALQTANASLVREAQGASKVQPRPTRNAILGLFLGLVLGVGLAFLREALDTKVRTSDEVARKLDLPILARIPAPPRQFRTANKLAMLADPEGVHAEPFRVLRTNVEFANLEVKAKTMMVTSAVEEEGKSTTAANLAVAFARSGKRTILVDLDLRRPFLNKFFPLGRRPGLTDVALRHVSVEEALAPYPLTDGPSWSLKNRMSGNGTVTIAGRLEVIGTGPLPPNPGEFLGSHVVDEILAELAERADLVLIDAAPLLSVGDALALSARVEALLLVARIDRMRRPIVRELQRTLEASPARPLGVIVTAADSDETYGYGYSYKGRYAGYARRPEEREGAEAIGLR